MRNKATLVEHQGLASNSSCNLPAFAIFLTTASKHCSTSRSQPSPVKPITTALTSNKFTGMQAYEGPRATPMSDKQPRTSLQRWRAHVGQRPSSHLQQAHTAKIFSILHALIQNVSQTSSSSVPIVVAVAIGLARQDYARLSEVTALLMQTWHAGRHILIHTSNMHVFAQIHTNSSQILRNTVVTVVRAIFQPLALTIKSFAAAAQDNSHAQMWE
eukprot:4213407-Amphidinium_carterae.1